MTFYRLLLSTYILIDADLWTHTQIDSARCTCSCRGCICALFWLLVLFVFILFVLICLVQCCCDLFGVVSVLLWFCLLCSVMLCCVLFLRLVFCLCVCSVCSALFYSVLFCCCWSILLRYAWKRCLCDKCISFGSVDIWSQASLGLLCCAS